MSIWFITGASRGFGLEIARKALAEGDAVIATARNAEQVKAELTDAGDRLLAVNLDVTDQAAVQQAVAAGVEAFGRIDVLVNNAGRGLLGAVEEASDAEVRAIYDVNVFGLLAVTRAVLPVMRRQRSGRVLNITSVGGFTSGQGWGVYGSTKFAVEGMSEAMRVELAPLGIEVIIIEPGVFRTDFLDDSSLRTTEQVIEDYAQTAGQTRVWRTKNNHAQAGDPAKAAAAIVSIAGAGDPPLRLQLGADCVARVEAKLHQVKTELGQWREVAVATAYDDAG
ncbi:oxidoreductase [Spirillospora sp. CA-294931]|uniref:oxidoreductase n=1 Tax=Spirillospora sp. CA-294931 TaxID=3240042 RepID=UPI003D8D8112